MSYLDEYYVKEFAMDLVAEAIVELSVEARAHLIVKEKQHQNRDEELHQEILDYCDDVLANSPDFRHYRKIMYTQLSEDQMDFHGTLLRKHMNAQIKSYFNLFGLSH